MKDEKTGEWTGYCIDLAKGISEQMDFEYDLVLSNDFGRRLPPNGRWDGLTGDIVHGVLLLFQFLKDFFLIYHK